ncbi:2'-5' RNA ligase family protein [Mesorhizobium opportunistum]|uniref:2',5' RNA ligase n=1 Tax=Mesorhizobium opportunistum (strain LMG 24607 / HAMBI 3007 / WSM2075) TaxID=536019 RepID=F7YCZ6_MESOW|nr:2'-5' RNA ligase family protein [Mesorhizobium opportunistum]AEH90103.1 2',5' RNA ligase [Mesorhizobium opportunistum WSM2075]
MYLQGEFDFGIPEPPWRPKRPDRAFFGLFLQPRFHAPFADLQNQLCHRHGIVGKRLSVERFHLSLRHAGDYRRLRSKVVFAASRSGRHVQMPAFEVTFGHVGSFPGRPATRGRPPRHPFVLLADDGPVFELHKLLGVEMLKNGLKAPDHFVPHLTLAYDQKFVPRQPIEPITFVANDFILVHSLRGLTKYLFLDRWPLMEAS